jgi:hypothetical protein
MFNVLIKIVLIAPILSDVCCNMTYYVGTTTQKNRLVVMLAALHAEFDCILKYSYIIRRQASLYQSRIRVTILRVHHSSNTSRSTGEKLKMK